MSKGGTHRIFVYGTLKRGQPNHYLIEGEEHGTAKYIGKGCTVSKWPLVVATPYNIPFMLDAEGTGKKIKGDIFEIDDKMLKRLDELEKYPSFYDREDISVIMQSDDNLKRNNLSSAGMEKLICSVYILRNFKDELLKLSFIEDFANSGYVLPSERPKDYEPPHIFVKK